MNRNEPQAMLLTRPLTERVAEEICAALSAVHSALASLANRRAVPPAEGNNYDSIAHLNEHVLKDIGAPHWLVARAATQRETQQLQWVGLDLR